MGNFNSRLLDKGRNAVRGIDLQARGIQTPLCNVLASPDGQSLIVDSSRQDVVRAIQESGITVLGGTIQQAPPYAAQALLFETRNEQDDSAPPLFVPNGFPDVQSFYKQVFRHVEVVPVACTELLKMGAHLREMFLHIIPVQDVFGRYTGAFRDIHRHAPLREKMGKGDASFQYEKDGKPYNHRQSYFPEELTDPYNPFGGLHLPADHPLKKAHDEMSAAFQRRRQSRHFMHQPMYNDTRRNTTPMWQPGESAPETAAEWKRAPVARSNKGGGPL
ncbi:hypothetical protein DIPPA_34677 [Diplonema papillatum]|nr:hypothetical protein DIPPA_34677 [Diplonema papillatum]